MFSEGERDLAPCPCGEKAAYGQCCKRYHLGFPAENALKLMRSRYSAYALGNADYIIATTHPDHVERGKPLSKWKSEIESFSKQSRFLSLKVQSFQDGEDTATVSFSAALEQNKRHTTLREKSLFKKVAGRWLYLSGELK